MNTKFLDSVLIGGNVFTYVLALNTLEGVLRLVSIILSIVISIVILVSKIIEWYKKAKADGKITVEEIKEGVDIVKEGAEDIKETIDNATTESDNTNSNKEE